MNPETHISIKIPVRYYLKLFLAKKKPVEPFVLTNRSCHISALLMEPMKKGGYIPPREELPTYYNAILEISMNTAIMREGRFLIEKDVVLRIDNHLYSLYRDEMIQWVHRETKSGKEIQAALLGFLEYYEIPEDEMPLATAQKIYYRARFPKVNIQKETPEQLRRQLTFVFK